MEITCDKMSLSQDEINHVMKISEAQDLATCLKGDSLDTNIVVAKIICLDLGWHLEFRQSDVDESGNFLLVIPALRYD